ncbi:MAG: formate dehydrogenase accessory sulfurtransferase FdhD [Clostridiales bacterium]|mgnify:CR=1 FL=1|jgi:FdhD protein|nr:formate dehydrogenase accessory sulfurtransferase FdhD [Clostridiales bacterium]
MLVKEIDNVTKIESNRRFETSDRVINDAFINIIVDGKPLINLYYSPESTEALVYGHLLAEKIISSKDDVKSLKIDQGTNIAEVTLFPGTNHSVKPNRNPNYVCKASDIMAAAEKFIPGSENFRDTGALHSAALCKGSDLLYFNEDLSRHCAIDKILGMGLLNDIDLSQCYIMTSGRLPSDMFDKIVAAGIPAIVSRSAPSKKTVEMAKKYNTIVCGFVRANRMNIYNGSERII